MATNENKNEKNRLIELGGSDYKIADGQSNIKGWKVKDEKGLTYGTVDELIFNPASRKVRYLVLDMDKNNFGLDNRKVLVPIGKAILHDQEDEVILSEVGSDQLKGLPKYEKDNLTLSTESSIRNVFSGTGQEGRRDSATYQDHDEDFYEHDHFNEDRFYGNRRKAGTEKIPIIEENLEIGKREEETGAARITSTIEERPIEEKIKLKEEHVDVNRTPADRPATDKDLDTFKEGEMDIPVHKEVPVVNKEARVVEEVNINKRVSEDEKTVSDTVRRTEVDTENIDRDDRRNRDNRDDRQDRDNPDRDQNRDKDKW